ncbi:uncharacterized protein CC84DRAFT_1176904 [Paraphaeosphaeria sporulosa]|uniref:Uncharacterized protein n=1 Tax=Paraphaeosphaeria sporulosa TaxID=1460663 RepID=A0A177CD52_9PLEO|nr:uncharacterized protein CC84DRAFT_1176904 [Paraphaeosphaeria sporulosa]OAG04727.1 hypothetical protein CC84DRAFT_1176904 [Paraphaeosphaeria sporulosa]
MLLLSLFLSLGFAQSSGLWLVADIQIIQWQTGIMNDHPHRLDLCDGGSRGNAFQLIRGTARNRSLLPLRNHSIERSRQLDYRPGLMWNIRETSNRYHFLVSSEQDGQQHFSITVTRYYAHCENMKEPMNLNFEEVDMALSGQLVEWQVTLRTGSMIIKGSCTHHD